MAFELIAFDIDGTLTQSKSPLEDNPLIDTDKVIGIATMEISVVLDALSW